MLPCPFAAQGYLEAWELSFVVEARELRLELRCDDVGSVCRPKRDSFFIVPVHWCHTWMAKKSWRDAAACSLPSKVSVKVVVAVSISNSERYNRK